ncbi:hypothetical protein OG749_08865 [Streptomyces nojiriensis]|uniref:hypothetical protein n=1 Tax=Streptomyces nojiriensis TaxID=66374 RepID=UPI002E198C96
MPLVYVHGIANRRERGAHRADTLRDAMFREHLLSALPGGADHRVYTAHWGDLGGRLAWNGDSFPEAALQRLGTHDPLAELADEVTDELARTTEPRPERLVLDVALRSLPDAVDLLFVLAGLVERDSADGPDDGAGGDAEGLAALAKVLSDHYALPGLPDPDGRPPRPWLTDLRDDEEFLAALAERSRPYDAAPPPADQETLGDSRTTGDSWLSGAWRRLGSGVVRLRRAATGRAMSGPVGRLRTAGVDAVPLLIGDVTTYLARRGTREEPGPIVTRVAGVLDRALAERADGSPLIVVAHSMGGNIVHDLLTHYRPDLKVDVLVTLGSQTGLFEELKLFRESDPAVTGGSGARVAMPAAVGRWLNVVDGADPLAFCAEPVFEGVTDYAYTSGRLWAHSGALHQPMFHARLARRLAEGDGLA